MNFLMSSPVFTGVNVHILSLLERRAASRRYGLFCRVSCRLHRSFAALGISLVDAAERRSIFEGSPAEWQYNTSEPCMEAGSSRCSTPRPAARSKPCSPEFAVYHARFACPVRGSRAGGTQA